MKMNKEELIRVGESLLAKTYKKDVFGVDSEVDVLPESLITVANKWEEDLHIFFMNMDNKDLISEVESYFPLVNGYRFRPHATRMILRILNEVVE